MKTHLPLTQPPLKRVILMRHSDTNTMGDLEAVLRAHQVSYSYASAHRMTDDEFDSLEQTPIHGVIVMGGEMCANDTDKHPFLVRELRFIQDMVARKIPLLGICLGAQLLAKAMGSTITRNAVKEVGWTPITLTPAGQTDPVLSALGEDTPQFQWHEDTFSLPDGAIHLAQTPDCQNQAYRLSPQTYGVQFHPEVSREQIRQWLDVSKRLPAERKAEIWTESETHYAAYHTRSAELLDAFLKQAFSPIPNETPSVPVA